MIVAAGLSSFASAMLGASGGLAIAVATWFGHRRDRAQHSGTIATSDAGEIWAAAGQLRHDLTARAEQLEEQVRALMAQVEHLEQANRDLQSMNRSLSGQVLRLTELLRSHGIEATFHEHEPGGL